MSVVIRMIEVADFGPPGTNRYVMDFDMAAHNGGGAIQITADISQAKQFATVWDAAEFWQTAFRPDGGINRPMTAFTVEIVSRDK